MSKSMVPGGTGRPSPQFNRCVPAGHSSSATPPESEKESAAATRTTASRSSSVSESKKARWVRGRSPSPLKVAECKYEDTRPATHRARSAPPQPRLRSTKSASVRLGGSGPPWTTLMVRVSSPFGSAPRERENSSTRAAICRSASVGGPISRPHATTRQNQAGQNFMRTRDICDRGNPSSLSLTSRGEWRPARPSRPACPRRLDE